ncbi:MAG: hypothetical protein IJE97_10080 [Thermoguttaceae bacterium]|nr:hypothetical protein [Thermoguttaceae bacterium]
MAKVALPGEMGNAGKSENWRRCSVDESTAQGGEKFGSTRRRSPYCKGKRGVANEGGEFSAEFGESFYRCFC